MDDECEKYKVLVLGDVGVGKTAIIRQFAETRFVADYKLSQKAIDIHTKDIQLADKSITRFSIWNNQIHTPISFVRSNFFKGANGALLIFDVTRKNTMASVKNWLNEILQNAGTISAVLVGNKLDLTNSREVSTETGQKLADKLKISYIETSAKTGENVNEAFKKLSLLIRDERATRLTIRY